MSQQTGSVHVELIVSTSSPFFSGGQNLGLKGQPSLSEIFFHTYEIIFLNLHSYIEFIAAYSSVNVEGSLEFFF